MNTFKNLPVLKETKANLVDLPPIIIKEGMEEYSGWEYLDHIKWVRDITKLPVMAGMILATDEHCDEVWLLSRDHWRTTVRLIYQGGSQC